MVGGFRAAVAGRVTLAEFTYPRTTTWSLAEYGQAVAAALAARGLDQGWLLAESFGSQVAWAMLAAAGGPFRVEGVVFAGGFVRYGQRWLVRGCEQFFRRVPFRSLRGPLAVYAWVVRRTRPCTPAVRANASRNSWRAARPPTRRRRPTGCG